MITRQERRIIVSNIEIREALSKSGIKYYELANKIGIADATLSRKLRSELPENIKKDYLEKIQELAAEKLKLLIKAKDEILNN